MGIIFDTALSKRSDKSIDRTIGALARLHEFIATVMTCLREAGMHIVDGHRQKLHLDAFTTLVRLAHKQLVIVVKLYLKK